MVGLYPWDESYSAAGEVGAPVEEKEQK